MMLALDGTMSDSYRGERKKERERSNSLFTDKSTFSSAQLARMVSLTGT